MKTRKILVLAFLTSFTCSVSAGEIHVSPGGDDVNPGTADRPVRSLARAQELAVRANRPTGAAAEVVLGNGTWRIDKPLTFGPNDGNAVWLAEEPGGATISGGVVLTGWREDADGNWTVKVPAAVRAAGIVRELFVDGVRATRARTPNEGFFRVDRAAEDKRSGFTFNAGDLANVADLDQVELIFLHDWSITRVGVSSIDGQNRTLTTTDAIGANARHYAIDWFEPHPRYFVENSRAWLDRPGEWIHDVAGNRIVYRPRPGEKPGETEMVVPLAKRLIEVRGEPGRPVVNLRFSGINFEHCNWQIPAKGYAEGQANYHEPRTAESGILREIVPAAIQFELATDCEIAHSTILHLGGGGVSFGSRTRKCALLDSEVGDVSGNGVLIGEDAGRRIDGEPWWSRVPEQVATDNRMENCVVHDCGRQYYGAVGVWVGFTQGTRISDNEIRDLPYTGVSLGWMWNPTPTPNGNNVVAHNRIHDVMQVLSDGGGIYTLGLQPGTRLLGNTIYNVPVNLGRAESNGMFLDEGTTDIVVEDNVIYNIAKSPLRFHRAGRNVVRNNLLVVKPDVPRIRYNSTPEENIVQQGNTIAEEEARSND